MLSNRIVELLRFQHYSIDLQIKHGIKVTKYCKFQSESILHHLTQENKNMKCFTDNAADWALSDSKLFFCSSSFRFYLRSDQISRICSEQLVEFCAITDPGIKAITLGICIIARTGRNFLLFIIRNWIRIDYSQLAFSSCARSSQNTEHIIYSI